MNPFRRLGKGIRGWLPSDSATASPLTLHAGRRSVGFVLLLATITAILATSATFLVTEFVVAPVPGASGVWSSASVHGFPLPYSTSFCCGSGAGPGYSFSFGMNNSYFLDPVGLVADICVWLAISFGCIYAFTIRRFALSAVAGLAITLGTLLLSPLAIVAPTPALEATINPMGFPYGFLTYYTAGLGGVSSSGYEFSLGPAIADSLLWAGIVMAFIGMAILWARIRQRRLRTKQLLVLQQGHQS